MAGGLDRAGQVRDHDHPRRRPRLAGVDHQTLSVENEAYHPGVPPPLTFTEFDTLSMVCDTLLPEDPSPWRASVPGRAAETLAQLPNPDDLAQLRRLLRMLEQPAAGLLLGRRPGRCSAMSRSQRQAYLRALARHPVNTVRGGFQALKRLAALAYYCDADDEGQNPTWPGLGYPGPIASPPPVSKPIRPLAVDGDLNLDCDVAVVGSGAGGGVVAAELAAAGLDVLVLEKGGYYNEANFNQREMEMMRRLYLDGGLTASRDQGVVVLAGSCLGGGTVVNYTTSFRTPDTVRREWAQLSGLDFFTGDDFSRSLAAAETVLSANRDYNRPSSRDALMAAGLEARGWHVDRMPRDVAGCTQDDVCGYCGMGCVRGAKRSTLKTCLPAAVEQGARIIVGCEVQRVQVQGGGATGLVAHAVSHRVSIRSRAVVVAAGAIHTPAILLRSGLGPPVGERLRLHPVTAVLGRFAEEVRPWTGTIQALYSDQFADLDGGYGAKLETAPLHPLLMSVATPWESSEQFDTSMRDLTHTSLVGILLRDRFGGRVTINRSGLPVIRYRISSYDQGHIRQALQGAAQVLLAAGAREILSAQNRPVVLKRGGQDTVKNWMWRADRVGYGSNRNLYASFHQMGTCRMGSKPATSVVNGEGETHRVRNLFVADGSLFPSASGVNPMLTIATLAHYVAQSVKARF